MTFVRMKVRHRSDVYETELDDEMDPLLLARTFASSIGVASSDSPFRFAIIEGKGIVPGALLELIEVPHESAVRILKKN